MAAEHSAAPLADSTSTVALNLFFHRYAIIVEG
jgi:hypothetical protein